MNTKSIEINFGATADAEGKIHDKKDVTLNNLVSGSIYQYTFKTTVNRQDNDDHYLSIDIMGDNIDLEAVTQSNTEVTICTSNSPRLFISEGVKIFELEGTDYKDGDIVTVKLVIEFVSSDIQFLTNEVLLQSKKDKISNPICVGISDHILNFFTTDGLGVKTFPLDNQGIKNISMRPASPFDFKIIASSMLIELKVQVQINFWHENELCCSALLSSEIGLSPKMVTSTNDSLGFKIENAVVNEEILYPYYDKDKIINYFQSEQAIADTMVIISREIVSLDPNSKYSFASLANNLSLPNIWQTFSGFRVHFERFDYRIGYINNESVGFLFVVFSIESLHLPSPCSYLKNNNIESTLVNQTRSLFKDWNQDNCKPLTNWITLGFSHSSLNEIVEPFANQGMEERQTIHGRPVSGELYYYFRSRFDSLQINPTSLTLDLRIVDTGGKIEASIGSGCTKITGSVSISLIFEGIHAAVKIKRMNKFFVLTPEIAIDKISVQVGNTPHPVDQIIGKILTDFSEGPIRVGIALVMMKQHEIPLFLGEYSGIVYSLVKADYFENESFVLTVDANIPK